jgi:hypothetical protein
MAVRTVWCVGFLLVLGCGSSEKAQGGDVGDGGGGTGGAQGGGTGGGGGVIPLGGAAGSGVGGANGGSSSGGTSGSGGSSGAAGMNSKGGSPFDGLTEKPDVDQTPVASCAGKPDLTLCAVTTTPDRSYDVCVAGACVSPGCGDTSCNVPAPHFLIPPANGHVYLSLHAGAEPIVVDLATGLGWQGCVAGRSGETCETGQQSFMIWDDALAYCDALEWGGKEDWYLPDSYELLSLLDYAAVMGNVNAADNLALDSRFFPNSLNWSWSSHYASNANVFGVQFSGGLTPVVSASRSQMLSVRCARRGFSRDAGYAGTRFVTSFPGASAEKVIEDPATGLVWQGCVAGRSGADCSQGTTLELMESDWASPCEALNWAGYDDWRLPTYKELFSIAQSPASTGRMDTAIDERIFDVGREPDLASTTGPGPNEGHFLFDVDTAERVVPTGTYPVLCVRWK